MKYKVGDKIKIIRATEGCYGAEGKIGIITNEIPTKILDYAHWKTNGACKRLTGLDIDFPMVKWSDDEPWLIEDLKKLEVVDEYEK